MNTVNYHRDSDNRGIPRLMQDIQDHLNARGETNFSMTIEHLQMNAATLTNQTRATSYWDNALYEHSFQYLWEDQISPGILNAFNNDRYLTAADKAATIYIGNHDHSHVTWQAGAHANRGGMNWYRTQRKSDDPGMRGA